MKRTFDLILALLLGPLAIAVVLLASIAIRIESAGSAIFVQDRVGRHQRVFRCFKLRTMYSGTSLGASHEIGTGSVTRVGRFLRKSKIDELPQLWNVLKGDMSFVGPRPGLPIQVELTRFRAEAGVYEVLPGITGLAQVQGIDMSDPKRLAEIDRLYIVTRAMATDIVLLLKTLTGSGKGDPAERQPRDAGDVQNRSSN